MDKQTLPDRSKDLANKTPKEDSYLHVHLDVDFKLSPKQISTAIGKAVKSVGRQLILLLLQGSMVVKTPECNYPQLPVLPESIDQSQ
jgi:hypothetical protein